MSYSTTSRLINAFWRNSQKKNHRTFMSNMEQVDAIQKDKLTSYLEQAQKTNIGIDYNFKALKNYEAYSAEVPIIESYDQIQNYIDLIAEGENDVLFPGQPLFMESTSGSSARKLIPYTADLKNEFQSAVDTWLYQLASETPSAFHGKSYWSISPPLKRKEITSGGLRVGMESDTEYLNPIMAALVNNVLAVPNSVSQISNRKEFYIQTWVNLIKNRDLRFISVWSPQFLLTLIRFLFKHIDDIHQRVPRKSRQLLIKLDPDFFQLRSIFNKLALISCWTDGQAAMWIPQLRAMCEDVPIQSKGLLLTEGVVTTPINLTEQVLSYTSHFYEFRSEDGRIYLAMQLEEGQQYEVIITTGGGLYRYNTHDLVVCNGYMHQVPVLKFLGQGGNTSDMVGEKISEAFVGKVFLELQKLYSSLSKLFLIPIREDKIAFYQVLYEVDKDLPEIEQVIEQELRNNVYLDQALEIGQLNPFHFKRLSDVQVSEIIENYKIQKSIKDGDFKMPFLLNLDHKDFIL